MTNIGCLAIVGNGLGLVGSLILAFSLNPFLNMLKTTADAQQLSLQTMANPKSDIIVFNGFEEQLRRTAKSANRLMVIGALLLALGFVTQVVAIFLQ